MIQIYKQTHIYIVSPYVKYGGPRSLHQLCNILSGKGYNASIVYVENNKILNKERSVFDEYNILVKNDIKDSKENVIIVPETMTYFLNNYKSVRKAIWWLSIYYYRANNMFWASKIAIQRRGWPQILLPLVYIKKLWQNKSSNYIKSSIELNHIYHLYNTDTTHKYLLSRSVDNNNTHYLCGPLIEKYKKINRKEIMTKKENVVAFNPAKIEPKLLIKIKNELKTKNIRYIEITNMNIEEVYNALSKTKVYVDLGFFPGPERMPREAVCLYNNIITSNICVASNSIDVPINKKYKFSLNKNNIKTICELIEEMINNYDCYVNEFDEYRLKVQNQIDRFNDDISDIFVKE